MVHWNSYIHRTINSFYSCKLTIDLAFLPGSSDPFISQYPREFYESHFLRRVLVCAYTICLYGQILISCTTLFHTVSCLVFCSFCASFCIRLLCDSPSFHIFLYITYTLSLLLLISIFRFRYHNGCYDGTSALAKHGGDSASNPLVGYIYLLSAHIVFFFFDPVNRSIANRIGRLKSRRKRPHN